MLCAASVRRFPYFVDFHRNIILDVVVNHIVQHDGLDFHLADFEVRVVNRVVERKEMLLRVHIAPEHVHEERAFVVALLVVFLRSFHKHSCICKPYFLHIGISKIFAFLAM